MRNRITAIAAIIILATGFAVASEDTRWVNVKVTEHSEGTNVEVHLPLNLVLSVLKSVDVENFHRGHVDLDIDDVDIDWAEMLAAVKDAPDGQFVTVESSDANVSVRKEGGTFFIDVDEIDGEQAKVKVQLPVEFMDAIYINDESQIDIAAMLESFDRFPDGDIVTVESSDANVRVWIE
jgi:hypothetical protein